MNILQNRYSTIFSHFNKPIKILFLHTKQITIQIKIGRIVKIAFIN